MLERLIDVVAACFLIAFSLPLLVTYSILAWLGSMALTILGLRGDGPRSGRPVWLKRPSAGEFEFEHAIEAYEELIDLTLAEMRR